MQPEQIARRAMARLAPETAERLIVQCFRDFSDALFADMEQRPDVYRVAVEAGLPTLPPDEAAYLAGVWAHVEYQLARGRRIMDAPDPDEEPGQDLFPPAGDAWQQVLFSPFEEDTASIAELDRLYIHAGWKNAQGNELIDIEARLKEMGIL